ncbi:SWIM-type domain-containing protein [Caerostris darwini]|uniref:SWIM-type domain-containing protein n=1 Tax=Caerostris darwini TaxID=1538125 RepID=A0AAV4T2F3_9ARAC|nr:SWIM-type domain-containing protein [Caerostris darwini]
MEKKRMESDLLKNIKMPMQLQELLPCGYSYKVKKWTPFENKPNHFEAVILTNVYTEEEAQEWWHEFNVKSNTTMRVRATCPKTGKVNIFKIYLRCLHQGRADKVEKSELQQKTKTAATSIKRNTNCPAGMIVAIRRHIKYSRSKMRDPVDPVHPCEIQIRFIHNHPTNCADSLRFRPVSKEVEEKLINLYQIGHSPASALEMLKIDLQIKHASAYSQIISDRYHCPDKSFCYRLYYKHFGKDYAASSKKDVINLLNVKVLDYNTEMGESCFCIGISGTDYVIALCSPLMKRAHALLQSHTMVYIDTCESPSNKERSEHYILFMVAHTAAGGVPLGAILCTSNNDSILNLGFQLLKQLLPEHAFFGRGEAGPYAFMIEDSESLQTALRNVWPDSDVVICIFRILQSMWQWLWNEKHNIMKDHRLYLLYLTKTVLFASSETEIDEKYQALSVDNISIIYPAYLQQLNCLWEKKHMWGICFHRLLPLLGANNYYEAAVRALKDKVFEQTKSFNTIQLLNFMATHLDSYYKAKLLDILHNKVIHIFRSCYSNVIPSHIDREIKQVAGNYFLIPSDLTDEKIHTVDMELNTCSCSVGISGAFCIHQYWIFLKVPSEMFKVGIIDMELRQKLFVIATGNSTFEEISHSVAVAHSTLSQVMPNDASNINTENTSLSNVECIFPENNSSHSRDNHSCISASNVIISLDSNHELITLSSVDTQVSSKPFIKTTACIGQVTENLAAHSYVETDKSISNVDSEDVSTVCLENTSEVSEEKSEQDNSDMTKRMTKVMEKFEDFCQQVRDGLKNQPKDFVPALEIMMKTLERKGNSNDFLIPSLSFFGVLSAPSLINKGRKRSIASTAIGTEVMVPKVHGRQMITYGKKRPMIDNPDETLALKTSETIRNGTSNDEICELSKSK